jgi:hypothetical protein
MRIVDLHLAGYGESIQRLFRANGNAFRDAKTGRKKRLFTLS